MDQGTTGRNVTVLKSGLLRDFAKKGAKRAICSEVSQNGQIGSPSFLGRLNPAVQLEPFNGNQ